MDEMSNQQLRDLIEQLLAETHLTPLDRLILDACIAELRSREE